MQLDLSTPGRGAPLLLFDAADPANLGWFSRCQFYVDGTSGSVLQTPLSLANQRDKTGRALPHAVRLQIAKELPGTFRMPGRQPVTEQMVYAEATVALPLIAGYAYHKGGWKNRQGRNYARFLDGSNAAPKQLQQRKPAAVAA